MADGHLIFAGRVGSGIKQAELERLWQKLPSLVATTMPLAVPPPRSSRFGSPLVLSRVHLGPPRSIESNAPGSLFATAPACKPAAASAGAGARRIWLCHCRDTGTETPSLVAKVKYLTWTNDNLLRQVVYEGLREDKPAAEVRRELPRPKLGSPD
jgi:ATP-dependent DNA ligase